jgi:hypothetical protein
MAKPLKLYSTKVVRPRLKLTIFGDPGVGKTIFGSTAQDHPSMRNVLFADVEKGTLSLAHRDDIKRRPINKTKDLEELAWAFASGELKDYHTVVIDNATDLQTMNIREVVERAIAGGRNMVKNRTRTVDDVWQEDYLISTNELSRIFQMFRDLPINTVITTHLKRVYPRLPDGVDRSNVEPDALVPSLTQKLMERVYALSDFVWCLEHENDEESEHYGKRLMITVPKGAYKCKTRGARFLKSIGEVILNPNLPDIYDTFLRTANTTPSKRSA